MRDRNCLRTKIILISGSAGHGKRRCTNLCISASTNIADAPRATCAVSENTAAGNVVLCAEESTADGGHGYYRVGEENLHVRQSLADARAFLLLTRIQSRLCESCLPVRIELTPLFMDESGVEGLAGIDPLALWLRPPTWDELLRLTPKEQPREVGVDLGPRPTTTPPRMRALKWINQPVSKLQCCECHQVAKIRVR